MKYFIFICLFFGLTAFQFSNEILSIENVTNKQKFEVWVSEGNEVIFSGIVYPNRKVQIPMTPGKLYGILSKRLTTTTEYKVIEVKQNTDHTVNNGGIDYYTCKKNTSFYYLLLVEDQP